MSLSFAKLMVNDQGCDKANAGKSTKPIGYDVTSAKPLQYWLKRALPPS